MTDPIAPSATTDTTSDESWMTPRASHGSNRPAWVALAFSIGFILLMLFGGWIFISGVYSKDRAEKAALEQAKQTPAAAPLTGATNAKDTEIAQLRAELSALQSRGLGYGPVAQPVYQDQSALTQISLRLDRIEANQKRLAMAAASANAAATLEAAARKSAPFSRELLMVERTLDDPRLLDPIRPYAEKGVPSEALLAVQFPREATAAAVAVRNGSERKDVFSGLARFFSGIISIRHAKDDGGQSPDALLARAEAKLEAGDLEGAVGVIATLPPEARTALKPWLDEANKRLAITETTHAVTDAALGRLAQSQDLTVGGGAQ